MCVRRRFDPYRDYQFKQIMKLKDIVENKEVLIRMKSSPERVRIIENVVSDVKIERIPDTDVIISPKILWVSGELEVIKEY